MASTPNTAWSTQYDKNINGRQTADRVSYLDYNANSCIIGM